MREWLKRFRESRQMTQQNVADLLGITKQYYQQIEAHERQKKMDIMMITKLSEIFEIPVEKIISLENELTRKFQMNESDTDPS